MQRILFILAVAVTLLFGTDKAYAQRDLPGQTGIQFTTGGVNHFLSWKSGGGRHYFKKMAIFTNQAQLRYGNAVANSNVAVGEILEVLAATKTAVRKTYGQNDRVTYVVSIVNSGNTAMTGLTVADDLGAYAFQHRHTGASDVCVFWYSGFTATSNKSNILARRFMNSAFSR